MEEKHGRTDPENSMATLPDLGEDRVLTKS